jgi:hypothetical protein
VEVAQVSPKSWYPPGLVPRSPNRTFFEFVLVASTAIPSLILTLYLITGDSNPSLTTPESKSPTTEVAVPLPAVDAASAVAPQGAPEWADAGATPAAPAAPPNASPSLADAAPVVLETPSTVAALQRAPANEAAPSAAVASDDVKDVEADTAPSRRKELPTQPNLSAAATTPSVDPSLTTPESKSPTTEVAVPLPAVDAASAVAPQGAPEWADAGATPAAPAAPPNASPSLADAAPVVLETPSTVAALQRAPANEAAPSAAVASDDVKEDVKADTAPSRRKELPTQPNLSAVELSALLTRGDAVFGTGDLASARLFYERGANAGDGRAALRLGETFDPAFLARARLGRMPGDPDKAVYWYRRARDLGNREAEILLNRADPTRN